MSSSETVLNKNDHENELMMTPKVKEQIEQPMNINELHVAKERKSI